ncbi:MAG: ImmA/IrrE family metallo-endopeptidase [Planctomycetes bacterium]|nr:ImmA/IrrE family metallo-endopeptidase [Planctomycetota bacterium]
MLTEIPPEQYAAALDACADEVLRTAEIAAPPVDAILVARRLHLQVASDTTMDVRARFVRLGSARQGTILLADDPRPERRQWAVAHEIGEFVAHRVVELLGVDLKDFRPSGREQIANRLASCLLLPRQWFSDDGRAVKWDLLTLKEIYRTASHELIARRMLEMSSPVIVTLFDQGQPQWRRSNVLRRPPRLIPAEEKTWRAAFDGARATQYDDGDLPEGIDEVRCWPVHEPGWRRGILRTGLEAW